IRPDSWRPDSVSSAAFASRATAYNSAIDGHQIMIMTTVAPLMDFLAGQLADIEAGWSVGTFGAIAEFTRDAADPAELHQACGRISIVTDQGGLRIASLPELRLTASESPTTESWSHRVALCLPLQSCAMSGRTTLTEIGPDGGALRTEDRNGVLFDLG